MSYSMILYTCSYVGMIYCSHRHSCLAVLRVQAIQVSYIKVSHSLLYKHNSSVNNIFHPLLLKVDDYDWY